MRSLTASVGVTPRLVAGAWVGGEDQAVHLVSRGEGSVVALPIVGEFLKSVYKLLTNGAAGPYDCDFHLL